LFIVRAIVLARSKYIVYFLLSAWLEALEHKGRARALPREAKKLPLRGRADVSRRLAVVRNALDRGSASAHADVRALEDAAAALSVACEQLRELSAGSETADLRRPVSGASSRHKRRAA
jgi:hypothetical protein